MAYGRADSARGSGVPAEREVASRPLSARQATRRPVPVRSCCKAAIEELAETFAKDLKRFSPQWLCPADSPSKPPIDLADVIGVPALALGCMLAAKCSDQKIPPTVERQRRFAELLHAQCSSLWFTLNDAGVGPQCTKAIVAAMTLARRFTSLNLSANSIGDSGAAAVAQMLTESDDLVHVDLSSNGLGTSATSFVLEALSRNRSVTSLDLSSKPGCLRNRVAKGGDGMCQDAGILDNLLAANPVLAKLSLAGTSLGFEGAVSVARGLNSNSTLLSLDLASNDLGPRGAALIAEALIPCGLEELNLTDNRIGDDGFISLATCLGANPINVDFAHSSEVWGASDESIKTFVKYQDATQSLLGTLVALSMGALASPGEGGLARAAEAAGVAQAAIEEVSHPLPRLRVLLVGSNGCSRLGAHRLEESLQSNGVLERLVMDHSEHYSATERQDALLVALPLNRTLKSLSLSHCHLSSTGIVDLAKALALNSTLESVCLKGNLVALDAASALGTVLGRSRVIKHLNLSSCGMEDEAGVVLAEKLASNTSLEALHLRDNALREPAGRALIELLQRHATLVQLSVELNYVELRFVDQMRSLLDKNVQVKEKAKPQLYAQRIDELKDCQREANLLLRTLRKNRDTKKQAAVLQAAALQDLRDTQCVQRREKGDLELQLQEVTDEVSRVAKELEEVNDALRVITFEGEYEANQLRVSIDEVELRMRKHQRCVRAAQGRVDQFEETAGGEIGELQEDLQRVERSRDSAAKLAEASQCNLDNFTASIKSIEQDIAAGAAAAAAHRRHRRRAHQVHSVDPHRTPRGKPTHLARRAEVKSHHDSPPRAPPLSSAAAGRRPRSAVQAHSSMRRMRSADTARPRSRGADLVDRPE